MSAKRHHKKKRPLQIQRPVPGSCSACAKPLQHDTALIVRGRWYCMDEACRPMELRNEQSLETVKKTIVKGGESFLTPPLRRLLMITMVLCLIVFAALAMREFRQLMIENRDLKKENDVLRESRIALIDLFREQNSEKADSLPVDSTTMEITTPPLPDRRKHSDDGHVRQYHPVPQGPFSITNGPVNIREVSFTFDGGSFANAADAILDTLASRSVTATMFLTGEFIRKNPEVVRRIVAMGHECGNHTYNHLHLTTYGSNSIQKTLPDITAATIADQLERCERLFRSVTGTSFAPLWRAPYGEINNEICRWGYEAGYVNVGWRQGRRWLDGLDSNDWIPDSTVAGYRTPAEFLDKIAKIASLPPPGINGGIILMHLGTQRTDPALQTHRYLGAAIDTLRAKGVTIVPVSELMAGTGIDLASLRKRSDIQ